MANTATLINPDLDDFNGEARLYRLDPPIKYEDGETEYVVVSAVDAFGMGNETYIFPANEDGEVIDWGELDGSQRGIWDHEAVLTNAGYEVS